MSRYIGPKLRIMRRLGKLRGFSRKKPFRRSFRARGLMQGRLIPPGQHGFAKLFKSKPSAFLIRLKVKQRLRFNYGLTERQLTNYVRKAKKNKSATGQALLQRLEMRLDNIVFRLHMAPTIPAARQLITHAHIEVNQKKVDIPSYVCRAKDVISVAMKPASLRLVQRHVKESQRRLNFYKRRLERTLAFILWKMRWVEANSAQPGFGKVLECIRQGQVRLNNRVLTRPDRVCRAGDVLSLQIGKKVRNLKLSDYFRTSKSGTPFIRFTLLSQNLFCHNGANGMNPKTLWWSPLDIKPIVPYHRCCDPPPSSRGLGHLPFTEKTGIRIPLGVQPPSQNQVL